MFKEGSTILLPIFLILISGMWLLDYECDERGGLPSDLKRGVLSEDMLYNLLCDVKPLM